MSTRAVEPRTHRLQVSNDAPPPGHPTRVVLSSARPAIRVEALMGEDGPKVTSGYGGWQPIARPGRTPVTDWTGFPERRMSLEGLLLDGYAIDRSVEDHALALSRLARTLADGHPPILRATGAGIPPEARGASWVIDRMEWGQAIRRSDGARVRQVVTVELLEYRSPDLVRIADKRGRAPARTHVVRRGETLETIAARMLGRASRWREIAKLNGLRDPRHVKVGQRLRLPAAEAPR